MADRLGSTTRWRNSTISLGMLPSEASDLPRLVRRGIPVARLMYFQKTTGLAWRTIGRWVGIPPRTLARRLKEAKLKPDESDRVLRAARVFDQAAELFEGDSGAAVTWLQSPQRALGGQTPLAYASTEVGAREVENLITRLEQGVFT